MTSVYTICSALRTEPQKRVLRFSRINVIDDEHYFLEHRQGYMWQQVKNFPIVVDYSGNAPRQLECTATIRSLYSTKDIDALERVQRRFTKSFSFSFSLVFDNSLILLAAFVSIFSLSLFVAIILTSSLASASMLVAKGGGSTGLIKPPSARSNPLKPGPKVLFLNLDACHCM